MGGKSGFHFALHFLQQIAPSAARFGNRFGQYRMAPGQQIAKRQFLQLAVDFVQTQAVRNRAVNVQGLLRNAAPFGARHVAHSAHIMGTVGQLDEDDAHIARHGQQHFAKGLGLVFFTRGKAEFVQLGQSIDQFGHRRAKALYQFHLGHAAVFHGVVQERSHQGRRIEFPVSALGGHRYRVRNVRGAAAAQLAQMGLVGKTVGLAHLLHIRGRQIVQLGAQTGKTRQHRMRVCGDGFERWW